MGVLAQPVQKTERPKTPAKTACLMARGNLLARAGRLRPYSSIANSQLEIMRGHLNSDDGLRRDGGTDDGPPDQATATPQPEHTASSNSNNNSSNDIR